MGFCPRAVDSMSLWEFFACTDGVRRANGHDKPLPPSGEELDAWIASDTIH